MQPMPLLAAGTGDGGAGGSILACRTGVVGRRSNAPVGIRRAELGMGANVRAPGSTGFQLGDGFKSRGLAACLHGLVRARECGRWYGKDYDDTRKGRDLPVSSRGW